MNHLTELHELLSRERLLLDRLMYKVVCLRTLALGGHARYIGWASDEVESAAQAVAEAELRRDALYTALAAAHGLPEQFSFDALVPLTTEPMTSMMSTLRQEMSALATELRHHLQVTQSLATDGLSSAREIQARLAGVDLTAAAPAAPGGGAHVDARL